MPAPSLRRACRAAFALAAANRRTVSAAVGVGAAGVIASFIFLAPRPTRLAMTARTGDDTVVVNQTHLAHLSASVLDQYGRRLRADSAVRFQWISGDSIAVSSDGALRCDKHGNAVVRATFERLSREFALRCRPVGWIEAGTWMDLVAGDSPRDLSFVARALDGRPVTELRGAVTVNDKSIVAVEGTMLSPKRSGLTVATVEVGDAKVTIPILVYEPVTSFVGNPKPVPFMAMRVNLGRGDTIETPVPKAAFWVTYFSKDPRAAPPTIELRGEGMCTLGNGLVSRRIEDGQYAKYCYSGNGTRMRIAHGEDGAATVSGVVALRLVW